MSAKKMVGIPIKSYGDIWREFLPKALQKGCSPAEARAMHVRWRSIGKRLAAGRY